MSNTTIKRPTFPASVSDLTDMISLTERSASDARSVTVLTRTALTTANNVDPQSRLWTGQPINCSAPMYTTSVSGRMPEPCVVSRPGNTFVNMSLLSDPFIAELPTNYSTGLIRQYLPRINSTARRDIITEADFPADCDTRRDAFYAHYAAVNPNYIHMTGWGTWSLLVCMPTNMSQSPWLATRNRQHFSEELFLNISVLSAGPTEYNERPEQRGGLFKITLETTAGYFELPNYMNGEQPGPLLRWDPTDDCLTMHNCSSQTLFNKS